MNSTQADIDEFYEAMHEIWDTFDPDWTYKWQDTTVHKMGYMAEHLTETLGENFDFIDYWYNFFLSDLKDEIDRHIMRGINALWCNIWQEDFEAGYAVKAGDPLTAARRYWFASYMEGLVFAFRCSPNIIARFYGLDVFAEIAKGYPMYHCMGYDAFVQEIAELYGKPASVNAVERLNC